jgi:hypothetical protein
MSRRRLGQETFGFASQRREARAGLDALAGLLDWAAIELNWMAFIPRRKANWRGLRWFVQGPPHCGLVRSI